MKLDDFVLIAGQMWAIRTGEVIDAELEAANQLGNMNTITSEIKLRTRGRTKQAVMATLLHEITHILINNAGLEPVVFAGDAPMQEKHEEAVVTAVGAGMYQVLTDNKLWRGR